VSGKNSEIINKDKGC